MYDAPNGDGLLWFRDTRTGKIFVAHPNSPNDMHEVAAFEPQGALPDAQTERSALQDVVRDNRIIIAYEPPLKVEASGPRNLVAANGAPETVLCAAEGYQCESMTATVWVADPGETAGIDNTLFPLAANIAAGGTPNANFGPSNTDPFTPVAAPAALGLPNNILQQIEVIGYLVQGHEDVAMTIPFNMPVGQLIRLNAAGSSVKVKCAIVPRYFAKLGIAPSFQYIVAGTTIAADRQRNNIFDFAAAQLGQCFTAGTLPTTPVQLQGYVGRGFTAPVPPQRVFFGAIDAAAAQNTQYRCPIPRGAQTVLLLADASTVNNDAGGTAPFAGAALTFNFSTGGNTNRRSGLNFPANVTVPVPADATAIEVVNVGATVLPAGVPFQLQYDIGF